MAGYIALVHKDEGTSYGVSFPGVPGCISAGDTFEEAVANAREALAGHFAAMRADGEAMPAPRSFDQLKRDPKFAEDSADGIVTMVSLKGRDGRGGVGGAQYSRINLSRGCYQIVK